MCIRDRPLAVMIAIPEPWANTKNLSQKKRDFYQYYATMMEPWDGPASILFSDGDCMGAVSYTHLDVYKRQDGTHKSVG